MSVDLYVRWPNGDSESLPVAGQETAATVWAAWAREIGLKHYTGRFPMILASETVSEIAGEFRLLRQRAVEEQRPNIYRFDQLIEKLEKLAESSGWSASLG